jgi:nucleoid DNA-binding protein
MTKDPIRKKDIEKAILFLIDCIRKKIQESQTVDLA